MQQPSPIRDHTEDGFLLVFMVVLAAIILIFLAAAAPSVAKDLQREREVEMKHRGDQYVRAIRLYYRKFGHYPGSVDQLVKSNNIRFLRQKYIDPMTGKDDWRIIHVGENKTTVTGFFGQPLAGLPTAGLGSAAGMVSTTGDTSGGAGNIGSATGTNSASFGNTTFGGASTGSTPTTSGANSANSSGTGGTGTAGSTGTNGSGPTSTDATTFSGGGGAPIMGVSSLSPKESILSIRKQTTFDTWEFIYDPRIEVLYAKANIFGGGVASTGGGTGLDPSSLSSPGSSTNPGSSSNNGSTPQNSGSGGSSFGNSSSGSTGSSFGGSTFGSH
jgi:type II secretory pathway pseudopilin PulG